MVKIQILARILYKAFVLTMLILLVNPTAYWGIWAGLIIGYLTESVSLTGENKCNEAQLTSISNEMLDVLKSIENDDNSIPDVIWQMRNDAILKAKNILK